MVVLRALLSHHIRSIIKPQNQISHLLTNHLHYISPITHFTFSSLLQKSISSSAQLDLETDEYIQSVENGDDKFEKNAIKVENRTFVNKKYKKLEKTPSSKRIDSKDNQVRSKGLHAMFAKNNGIAGDKDLEGSRKEPVVMKKLSEDMLFFLSHLYKEGYFNEANFLPKKAFEISCFDDVYGREYIKCAAEKFGKDNQEIAKWLSASDLKLITQFGCPSLTKKSIFAAKRLRKFFKVQENTVCTKCALKQSCKFVNLNIWKGDTNNLHLVDVMKVIPLYALEATDPHLFVPDEITESAGKLLKQAMNLSETTTSS